MTRGRRSATAASCADDLQAQIGEIDEGLVREHLSADTIVNRNNGASCHPGVTLAVFERFGRVPASHGLWSVRKTGSGFQGIDPRMGQSLIPPHFTDAMREEAGRLLTPSPS
jgi:hypothetical protein